MIIIDLDDTIIATRRTLRREMFSRCADLTPLPDEVRAFLLDRADEDRSGTGIIGDACDAFGFDEELRSFLIAEYYENQPDDPVVELFEGAREGLETFGSFDRLVCVTTGFEIQQMRKIRNAGVSFDDVIVVSAAEEKALVYAQLLDGSDPAKFIVIGDKLSDVEPARELGMHAIRYGSAWDGVYAPDWFSLVTLVEAFYG